MALLRDRICFRTQVMFRRHRRIPLDANLKDTFTLEAVTQWCGVAAVAGPCMGKLTFGDPGFLIPLGLVIILSYFPSESWPILGVPFSFRPTLVAWGREELKVKGGYSHLEQSKDTIDVAAQAGEKILG